MLCDVSAAEVVNKSVMKDPGNGRSNSAEFLILIGQLQHAKVCSFPTLRMLKMSLLGLKSDKTKETRRKGRI